MTCPASGAGSSHDHGNCELCDLIESQLAEAQAACATKDKAVVLAVQRFHDEAGHPDGLGGASTFQRCRAQECRDCADALTSSPGRPLLDELARLREENERLRDRCEERAGELLQLREQSEHPKCAYCDFGERDLVSLDLLQWHVEKECGNHPIRALKDTIIAQADALRLAGEALEWWHREGCDKQPDECHTCRTLAHPAMIAARGGSK